MKIVMEAFAFALVLAAFAAYAVLGEGLIGSALP